MPREACGIVEDVEARTGAATGMPPGSVAAFRKRRSVHCFASLGRPRSTRREAIAELEKWAVCWRTLVYSAVSGGLPHARL